MMTDPNTMQDPPEPDLEEIEQRAPDAIVMAPVPATIEGPVHSRAIPNRRSSVDVFFVTTTPKRVFGNDEQRAVATMIGNVAWQYSRTSTGQKAPIPANVPLVLTHCDEIWASVASAGSDDEIAVIAEYI